MDGLPDLYPHIMPIHSSLRLIVFKITMYIFVKVPFDLILLCQSMYQGLEGGRRLAQERLFRTFRLFIVCFIESYIFEIMVHTGYLEYFPFPTLCIGGGNRWFSHDNG